MAQNKPSVTKDELLNQLVAVVQELPMEQIAKVSDFAKGLQANAAPQHPARGMADALLKVLDQVGPLQFESDELDILLSEIEAMRNLDLGEHG